MGFYDIDTSVRINGGLTVNGDTTIPSSNLYVGGNITGNTLSITTISGSTINASTFNEGGIALSSKYLGISGTAVSANNSGKLNNLDYTKFAQVSGATFTGMVSLTSNSKIIGTLTGNSGYSWIGFYDSDGSTRRGYVGKGSNGDSNIQLYSDLGSVQLYTSGNVLVVPVTGNPTYNSNVMWHAGNDGSGSGLDADKLDGIDSTGFTKTPVGYTTGNAVLSYDTRNNNFLPTDRNAGLYVDFKSNTTDSLNDGGTYHGVLTFRPYGSGGDMSGGHQHQLGFTDYGNIWYRISNDASTWSGWHKIWNDLNDGSGSGMDADTVDTIHGSSLVRNDITNQAVGSGFTMSGNAYVGGSTSNGALYVRTSSGSLGIQLAGDNSAQQSGVGAYINANGTANFAGTVTANALAVTSTSLVNNLNAQMVNSVKEPQLAKNQSVYELGGKGVYTGLAVSAQATPNMTVQIGAGTVYTDSGMRVVIPSGTNVSFASPSATYNRIDSVYVQGSSAGANEGVVTVMQGTASASPVAPTIPSDGVLLANVTIRQNAGSILSTDITDARVWKPLSVSNNNVFLNNSIYIGYLTSSSTVLSVGKPIKNTSSNNSITISAGSTSYTWTHNLNLSQYIVKLSWNNPEPHVYWSNKTTNAITINLDNAYDTDTIIDIGIEAF